MSEAVGATELERDARAMHRQGQHGHISQMDIATGVVIGRTSEFFDFFVYAIASVLVFPATVFPYVDQLTGTLYSFAILAIGFVARPFGTWLFTGVDRSYGRSVKLTIALFLLGGSTAAIAFLPSYASIGHWSAVILILCRIGQGLALGGAWDGLRSLLAMNAPANRRGWYAMFPQIGMPLAVIVASVLFAFLLMAMPAEDFLDWGWRYPFFVAFAINVVALFARLRIVAAPEYVDQFESRDLQPAPVADVIRHDWKTVIIGAFAPLASFALFHMVTVFPLSWVYLFTDEPPVRFLVIMAVAAVFGLGATLLSGVLADRIGRRSLLGSCAAAIAVFSGIAPTLLDSGERGVIIFMIGGFILFGLSFGQAAGSVSQGFGPARRYTGAALVSDLAWLFGAGFAPLVALLLSTRFGLIASGGYLASGALATLAALWFNRELARNIN